MNTRTDRRFSHKEAPAVLAHIYGEHKATPDANCPKCQTTDLRTMTDEELLAHRKAMGVQADEQVRKGQHNTILGTVVAQRQYEAAAREWMRRLEERGLI